MVLNSLAYRRHGAWHHIASLEHLWQIVDGAARFPESPEDMRVAYDKVTAGEISPDKLSDGHLFRKEGVEITAGGVWVVHRGLEQESRIIEAVEKLIALVGDENIPALCSAVASHYLFEYIHPFCDGNGRTGRYLLSLLLGKILSAPTALSLSRTIAEHRGEYYRVFKTVEDRLNHAELTFFIYVLLDFVRIAQLGVVERLSASAATLGRLNDGMEKTKARTALKGKEADVVYLLLQYETFGLFGDASLQEIADFLGVGKQQVRKYLASLEEKGVCQKLNNYNPVTFALTDDFKSACC